MAFFGEESGPLFPVIDTASKPMAVLVCDKPKSISFDQIEASDVNSWICRLGPHSNYFGSSYSLLGERSIGDIRSGSTNFGRRESLPKLSEACLRGSGDTYGRADILR
jgi:hypothetical protein